MSSYAIPRSDCLRYRYWPAPIRADCVPRCAARCFCRRHRLVSGKIHSTVDRLRHAMVRIIQRIGTSNQPGKIQIPIALRSTQTPAKHPAVSSLGACPTPAH